MTSKVQVGRVVLVSGSSIPKANGAWDVVNVVHDLATMQKDGPWFTTAVLTWPSTTP